MPQLSRWRRMQIPVIAAAAYWLVRLIGPTLRTEIVGVHNAVQIRDQGEPALGAFWHRCIFSAIWIWRNRGIVVTNTGKFDGQSPRRPIERLVHWPWKFTVLSTTMPRFRQIQDRKSTRLNSSHPSIS